MKLRRIVVSVTEQAIASAFTFCLFWSASRLLDQTALEIYTALFSLNQCFAFFLFGLVLQPMAASSGEDAPRQMGISIVLLVFLLFAFALVSPLAMQLVPSVNTKVTVHLWLLSVAFFASQCTYEAGRWLTIRLRGPRSAFSVTLARFALFFGGVAVVGRGRFGVTSFVLSQVTVNCIAMVSFALGLRGTFHAVRLQLPGRAAVQHFSNLGTSVANFATNFVTVGLVDRGLGGPGLTAFQALRSATNPIGLLSQVIDNHFSAELARSGRGAAPLDRPLRLALAGSAMLLLTCTVLGPRIVRILMGDVFVAYWLLLPLLMIASLAHALTRPIFVNWRLGGDTRALNAYTILTMSTLLPAIAFLGWTGRTLAMVTVFALLPATALVVDLLRRPAASVRASP